MKVFLTYVLELFGVFWNLDQTTETRVVFLCIYLYIRVYTYTAIEAYRYIENLFYGYL